MEKSTNFNFSLPSRDNDTDIADINQISDNFRIIDDSVMPKDVVISELNKKADKTDTPKITVDSKLSTTSANPVENKAVTTVINQKLNLSGGTMSGNIAMNGNDILTVKRIVFLTESGEWLNMGNHPITNLATPTADHHAANKAYVDNAVKELTSKKDWEKIQYIVRDGNGATYFPVGYEFETLDSNTGKNIIWVVRGHDHHTPANSQLTHSMTLEAKYVYSDSTGANFPFQIDEKEAFYYAAEELPAGTYNFTVAKQLWYTSDNGKIFQFTLTKAVPAGGQIVLDINYMTTLEGKTAKAYASASSTTVIETVTLTEGSEGISLGTTDGNSENVNHMHRIIFGSNNYAQSSIRQWLNSDKEITSVWTSTTKFDRPPQWGAIKAGFMKGLPIDFLEVVQPAIVPCRTNSTFEINSLDGTEFTVNSTYTVNDMFFILSRPEIYGTWANSSIKDGELLEYYKGLTDTERKKYDGTGVARFSWLRSPEPKNSTFENVVFTSGALYDGFGALNKYGVTPACIIA